MFHSQWRGDMNCNHSQNKKLRKYAMVKEEVKCEDYIHMVADFDIRKNITN